MYIRRCKVLQFAGKAQSGGSFYLFILQKLFRLVLINIRMLICLLALIRLIFTSYLFVQLWPHLACKLANEKFDKFVFSHHHHCYCCAIGWLFAKAQRRLLLSLSLSLSFSLSRSRSLSIHKIRRRYSLAAIASVRRHRVVPSNCTFASQVSRLPPPSPALTSSSSSPTAHHQPARRRPFLSLATNSAPRKMRDPESNKGRPSGRARLRAPSGAAQQNCARLCGPKTRART